MNNVFNKVTLKSLKKNRTRTIVTIIGIILSAAMICAVTTFASSIINYTIQVSEWENGSWHGNEFITSYETYKKIADSDAVKDTAYLQRILKQIIFLLYLFLKIQLILLYLDLYLTF